MVTWAHALADVQEELEAHGVDTPDQLPRLCAADLWPEYERLWIERGWRPPSEDHKRRWLTRQIGELEKEMDLFRLGNQRLRERQENWGAW